MTTAETTALWPTYSTPRDLVDIEAVPLDERGLPSSTYGVLTRARVLWPDRTAVTVLAGGFAPERAVSWTFAELFERTVLTANAFAGSGVRRGCAVGLLSPNVAELIPALLAAEAVGMAAPANPALSADHLAHLFTRAGIRVLVAAGPEIDARVWAAALQLAEQLQVTALYALRPSPHSGIGPELGTITGVEVGYLSDAVAAQPPAELVCPEPNHDDLAALFHTGGTTGTPKLAAHTHRNQVVDGWALAANSLLDEDSVLFAALPLFHVNALVVTLLAPMLRGQRVVWAGPLGYRDPELMPNIWKLVAHYRVATMSAVPTVYSTMADVPVDADISSLRFAMVGASALPPAVSEAFTAHTGVPLLQGYGLTEATCATARNFPGYPRSGSVGQRLPYQQVKVVEIDQASGEWTDVAQGRTGVLAIAGPTVFAGYVVGCSPDGPVLDDLGRVRDGWLDTGDLARIDGDGFIHLVGRAKDVIIRGGHNIDPATIENALLGHPDVTDASAVGRPDPHSGEVPVAYVSLRAGAAVTAHELAAFAAHAVPEPAAAPREVTVLAALPVTTVGKPDKVALRRDAMERAAREALLRVGIVARTECVLVDGELTVCVSTLATRIRVAAALDHFAFRWQLR